MHDERLKGKVAVVTGGSRGIGRHIAMGLHQAGAFVAITGRNAETIGEAAERVGNHCRALVCDQRDPDAIRRMSETVIEDMGGPDILVNNAGVFRHGLVEKMSPESWHRVIDTNLTGVFLTTQAFLPSMLAKERADIFMISSMSGKKGDPGTAAYAASKFGLQGFSQSLMYEVRKHNIRVMVLNPSSTDTGDDDGPAYGSGVQLHAADIGSTIVHLACMPGRTMIRDMDVFGTNP